MKPTPVPFSSPELQTSFEALLDRFRGLDRVLVAFSGGVDSTLALKVGTLALGENCIGVTARSETLSDSEFDLTVRLAVQHGFSQKIIEYSELEIDNYAENPINRCYFCRHELFSRLENLARELHVKAIVDGTNADDVGDYRPGMQAAREFKVVSVLKDAGIGKERIRSMARELGLENWDKPAGACLSSRIPYGSLIDKRKLSQVAEGEAFLRSLGFAQCRVRHHDTIARLEVEPSEIARLTSPEIRTQVEEFMKSVGFNFVTVDLAGYRMGSLNELVSDENPSLK